MSDDIHDIADTLAQVAGGPLYMRCPHGCELGIMRAGQCDHGHTLNSSASEDLQGMMTVATVAFRVSAYHDALIASGFSEAISIILSRGAQDTMLRIALEP
jgi:hypothetical protein